MDFNTLYEENKLYIYRFAMKLTCDPNKAEDLTQETFLLAWKNKEQLQSEEAIKGWLRSICYHSFLLDYRKNSKLKTSLEENIEELEQDGTFLTMVEPQPEEEVLVADEIKNIQTGCFYAMVRKLSFHQRIAFSLIDMFGMSVHEVASLLQLSDSAVKGLLHRARKKLISFFGGHCNLIHFENPCRCQAWIDFSTKHEENKEELRKSLIKKNKANESMDLDIEFDQETRSRILYLYKNMVERYPGKEWFATLISQFK